MPMGGHEGEGEEKETGFEVKITKFPLLYLFIYFSPLNPQLKPNKKK